jgi:hypothetical protein
MTQTHSFTACSCSSSLSNPESGSSLPISSTPLISPPSSLLVAPAAVVLLPSSASASERGAVAFALPLSAFFEEVAADSEEALGLLVDDDETEAAFLGGAAKIEAILGGAFALLELSALSNRGGRYNDVAI